MPEPEPRPSWRASPSRPEPELLPVAEPEPAPAPSRSRRRRAGRRTRPRGARPPRRWPRVARGRGRACRRRAAGTLAGGSRRAAPRPAAAAAPRRGDARAPGALTLQGPAGWTARDAPDLPGLELRDAAALGRGDATIVAGMTDAAGPALLPAAFTAGLSAPPARAEGVEAGEAQAFRYADLRHEDVDGELTVLAAPTTAGIATIACLGGADDRARCEAAAGTLALADGARAFALGPSERYARELAAPIDQARRRAGGRDPPHGVRDDAGRAGQGGPRRGRRLRDRRAGARQGRAEPARARRAAGAGARRRGARAGLRRGRGRGTRRPAAGRGRGRARAPAPPTGPSTAPWPASRRSATG